MSSLIGRRVRQLRETNGWKQGRLANGLGLANRQTVGSIESGERQLTAEELIKLVEIFGVDLNYFTDPFLLDQEVSFSWRKATGGRDLSVDEFEEKVSGWFGLYSSLVEKLKILGAPSFPDLGLSVKSAYEEAQLKGEEVRKFLGINQNSFEEIRAKIEEKFNTPVLSVPHDDGISGAACHGERFSFLLINSTQPEARRNFTLSHELFHLLTWEVMEPETVELECDTGHVSARNKRIEQLADNFASAFLVPISVVESWGRIDGENIEEFIDLKASELNISSLALMWRLHNLGIIDAKEVDRGKLANVQCTEVSSPMFGRLFVSVLNEGLDKGLISLKKALSILRINIDDLVDEIHVHNIEPAFDI